MRDKGVYRTAPATPRLLFIQVEKRKKKIHKSALKEHKTREEWQKEGLS